MPHDAIICNNVNCEDDAYISAINVLYDDLIEIMSKAGNELVSQQGDKVRPYKCRPGWNDHARDLHTAARECFIMCIDADKPKNGSVFGQMKSFRASSNQITFILHIQGVFSLPGRGFHQRVTLISSVPMTLDDVIVHVRQFIIALVSVGGCSSFSDPDGFLDVPDSSVGVNIVDKEPNQRIRQIKEAIWIRKTRTPINRDEGNYELPHVYDDVIKRHRY